MFGNLCAEMGDIGPALSALELAVSLGEQAGFAIAQVMPRLSMALIYATLGDNEHGLALAQQAALSAEGKFLFVRGFALGVLARAQILSHDLAAAAATLRAAYTGLKDDDMLSHTQLANGDIELALRQGDARRALEVAEKFVASFRQFGLNTFVTETLYQKARALRQLGQLDDARAVLLEARAQAEAMGARRHLWQIFAGLTELAEQRGFRDEARAYREALRTEVEFITAQLPTDALRRSFLHVPELRVLTGTP